MATPEARQDDERQLAELGYRQDLARAWSGFTNFAISFTIISVLAGTFTTFAFAWQNGGPIAVAYFAIAGRHRLVLSPEEEFAMTRGLHDHPEREGYGVTEREELRPGAPAAEPRPGETPTPGS